MRTWAQKENGNIEIKISGFFDPVLHKKSDQNTKNRIKWTEKKSMN